MPICIALCNTGSSDLVLLQCKRYCHFLKPIQGTIILKQNRYLIPLRTTALNVTKALCRHILNADKKILDYT